MKQYEEKTEKEAYVKEEDYESMYDEDEEEEPKKASCDDECPPGFAEVAGECVAVTCELNIDDVSVIVASLNRNVRDSYVWCSLYLWLQ